MDAEKFRAGLHREFFGGISDTTPEQSVSYKKAMRGNLCIPKHIAIWIKHHPGEIIYAGDVIHHINGDHRDNRPENLEKLTYREHSQHNIGGKQKFRGKKKKHIQGASVSYNDYINGSKQVAEHIIVWIESHPGEIIYAGEVIHHINGDHQDNRPENLEKVPKKQHERKHCSIGFVRKDAITGEHLGKVYNGYHRKGKKNAHQKHNKQNMVRYPR